jgi:hypothetical protein
MVNEGDNENKVDDSRAAVAADVHMGDSGLEPGEAGKDGKLIRLQEAMRSRRDVCITCDGSSESADGKLENYWEW